MMTLLAMSYVISIIKLVDQNIIIIFRKGATCDLCESGATTKGASHRAGDIRTFSKFLHQASIPL